MIAGELGSMDNGNSGDISGVVDVFDSLCGVEGRRNASGFFRHCAELTPAIFLLKASESHEEFLKEAR